jgi:serine-type D-Ala-D-Ala carboxypeptidase/endopeptidase (penicillin-binding protein 4)
LAGGPRPNSGPPIAKHAQRMNRLNRITRATGTLAIIAVPLLLGIAGPERLPTLGAETSLQQTKGRTKAPAKKVQPKRARPKAKAAPAPPPMVRTQPRSAEQLQTDLAQLLTQRVRSGQWGAMVSSLTRGDTLFAANEGLFLAPASTMKLLTAAIALERLGPDHRLRTDVLRDGNVDGNGTLNGNIYIRGDGDPTLSRRFHGGDYASPMTKLAEFVAASGIRQINGNVIGDASAFDTVTYPAGWLPRYRGAGYAARVSPLSLNDNIAWVTVEPGRGGQQARVWLEPATTTIRLTGGVRTVAGSGTSVRAATMRDGTTIQVSGSIGAGAGVRRFGLVMENPSLYTTGAFHAALVARGITVNGGVAMGPTPSRATLIGALESPPVEHMVAPMNRESINLYAELLFRNAARGTDRNRQGTAAAGEEVLREFFASNVGSRDAAGLVAADGSGLSTLDRISSRQMIQLLHYAHRAQWGPYFHASMPVAGLSELLRLRMRQSPAEANLHAKTGTTDEVIGLAGYVTAENGELLAFSFIYNGTDRWNARATIDVMCETLAAFARL